MTIRVNVNDDGTVVVDDDASGAHVELGRPFPAGLTPATLPGHLTPATLPGSEPIGVAAVGESQPVEVGPGEDGDLVAIGQRLASAIAGIATAYGLSLEQYEAIVDEINKALAPLSLPAVDFPAW